MSQQLFPNRLKLYILGGILLCCCVINLKSQSFSKLKEDGLAHYKNRNYIESVSTLAAANSAKSGDEIVLEALAYSYFETNQLEECKKLIISIFPEGNISKPSFALLNAKLFHEMHEFDQAILAYKHALRLIDKPESLVKSISNDIRRAAEGLRILKNDQLIIVDNLGDQVNSKYDEIAPLPSYNYIDKIYFGAATPNATGGRRNDNGLSDEKYGNYCSDLFSASLQNGSWAKGEGLSYMLNGPRHEYPIGFSNEGKVLHYFKGYTLYSGDFLVDTFKRGNDQLINPQYFNSSMNPNKGDKDPFFVNDTILIFSSNRSNGFGGFDLYITVFSNKEWSEPTNLGESINTPFDEKWPCLASDGKTLFWSSNNLMSIGGFDIFQSTYIPTKFIWTPIHNMGLPVNSAADEECFKINNYGSYAYFSSSRKTGYGMHDIYAAYLNENDKMVFSGYKTPPAFLPQYVEYKAPEELTETELVEQVIENKEQSKPIIYTFEAPDCLYDISDYEIISKENAFVLDKYAILLIENPILHLVISAHNNSTENLKTEAYLTLTRAEQVADYLIRKGVKAQQLYLRGCGPSFPLIKENLTGKDKSLPNKFNKRIELDLANLNEAGVQWNKNILNISKGLRDDRGTKFRQSMKGLSYKVQAMSTSKPSTSPILDNQMELVIEKKTGPELNKYMVGLGTIFEEITPKLTEIKGKGLTDAFIIPYINGLPITKNKASILVNTYPDLKNYLDASKGPK